MADEPVEPPNEKIGWREIVKKRERDYRDKILIWEIRVYENALLASSLATFSFWGEEIGLKMLSFAENKDRGPWLIYFLKLPDGSWIKGVPDGDCDLNFTPDSKNRNLIKISITIQTENGSKTRIFQKQFSA